MQVATARLRRRDPEDNSMLVPARGEWSTYQRAFDLAVEESADSDQVTRLLWKSHAQGDARATYALATWYLHGVSQFAKDPRKAAPLLRAASRAGIAEASFDLAVSYEKGAGVTKSPAKAARLYIKAAQQGDRDAVDAVVQCVLFGVGLERNRELALLIRDLATR